MKLKNWHILLILGIIFFLIYSYVSFFYPPKFISPDETTNYYYSNLYSQTGDFFYSDELNNVALGIVHSRSNVYLDNGRIVSFKFIGFPLINGTFAIIIPEVVRFLTPLLAIIGAIFLYLLIKDLFGPKLALLSFLLLLTIPAYWYWSTLVMYENIAGVTLLVIALRYLFRLTETSRPEYYVLTGLFLGLTLFIRPEYILIFIPLVILFIWNIKKIDKNYILYLVIALVATSAPFFILNHEVYGSPLLTGQHVSRDWSQTIPTPRFGIDILKNVLDNSYALITLTPILFFCTILGIIHCLRKRENIQYIVFFIGCSLFLSLYFLVSRSSTSGLHMSHVRYLLVVYMLSLPFILKFFFSFRARFVSVLIIAAIIITNVLTVIPEVKSNIQSVNGYARLSGEVAKVTEPDAVIFLDYWDKAIFPERRVGIVRDLPEENRSQVLSDIAIKLSEGNVPVYLLIEKHFLELVSREDLIQETLQRGYTLKETGVENLCKLEKL